MLGEGIDVHLLRVSLINSGSWFWDQLCAQVWGGRSASLPWFPLGEEEGLGGGGPRLGRKCGNIGKVLESGRK